MIVAKWNNWVTGIDQSISDFIKYYNDNRFWFPVAVNINPKNKEFLSWYKSHENREEDFSIFYHNSQMSSRPLTSLPLTSRISCYHYLHHLQSAMENMAQSILTEYADAITV